MNTLSKKFVCGYRDITGLPWSGSSDLHKPDTVAVSTTNGAGPRNIQIFFLSADSTVLHCLLGYWNPDDLLAEAELAEKLNQVWLSPNLTKAQKDVMFKQMQLKHIEQHSAETVARSKLQSFDEFFEGRRRKSDFVVAPFTKGNFVAYPGHGGQFFKTTDTVIHERMAARPFVPYQQFDVVAFSDYGSPHYDKSENAATKSIASHQEPALFSPHSLRLDKKSVRVRTRAQQRDPAQDLAQLYPQDGLSDRDKELMSAAGPPANNLILNRGVMTYGTGNTPQAVSRSTQNSNRLVNYNWDTSPKTAAGVTSTPAGKNTSTAVRGKVIAAQ